MLELELPLDESWPKGVPVLALDGVLDGFDVIAGGVVLIARVVGAADEAGDADDTGADEEDGVAVVASSLYKVFALH